MIKVMTPMNLKRLKIKVNIKKTQKYSFKIKMLYASINSMTFTFYDIFNFLNISKCLFC